MNELTIKDLYQIEPRLATVAFLCWRLRGNTHLSHCNAYEAGKGVAQTLVGWNAEKRVLRTAEAYDVFIDELARVTGM